MKKILIGIMISLSFVQSYPQAMCISNLVYFVEKANLEEKNIKEKTKFINIDIEIPQIKELVDEEGQKVINREIEDYTNLWITDTKNTSEDLKPTIPYELFARYKLTNNKDNILSFYIDFYQFSGGAHGITVRKTYNINTCTGKKIELKDLFEENFDYKNYINDVIEKDISKNPDYYFTGKDGFNGIKDNQEFYIEDGKLMAQFAYYEIAPYVTGMPTFEIPYDIKINCPKN